MISQQEAFWDKQRESLDRLRKQIIDERSQRRTNTRAGRSVPRATSKPSSGDIRRRRSEPDSDAAPSRKRYGTGTETESPAKVVDHARHHMTKAKSTTPPRNLPRMTSPQDQKSYKNIHAKKVRGSKYNVVPPVRPKKAFHKQQKRRPEPSSDDSWGDSSSESSDEQYPPYAGYPQPYPYPMFPPHMYAPPPLFYQRPRARKKRYRRREKAEPASYVIRPTHDQGTSTVDTRGTQWQEMIRMVDTGVDPINTRRTVASRASRVRATDRGTDRDLPVQIYVTPASRSPGSRNSLQPPSLHPELLIDEDDFDEESIYSRSDDALDSNPEIPPRAYMPKYYYYYSKQRPRYNRDLFDERTNSVLRRYKYYYAANTLASPIQEEPELLSAELPFDLQVLKTLLDDEEFAESVVNRLLNDFLYEDIIPDVLIDALSINTLPSYHPMFGPSKQVANDILQTELVRMGRQIVREVVRELVEVYLTEQDSLARDPLEEFLDSLFTEAMMELLYDTAQDSVNEMAHEYIVEKAIRAVIMMMVNEIIEADGQNLLDEAIYEVMLEDFLEDEVLRDVIDVESRDVAEEVINEYDTKIRRRAIKEINRLGREKFLESNILDILLTKIARDGKIWTEAEYMDKMLHGMILEIILRERGLIEDGRDSTVDNKAIKKVHERMVTDVALDVVLDELTQWLDEDLAELDERERGINVQDDSLPTEVNSWLYGEVDPLEPLQTPSEDQGQGQTQAGQGQKGKPSERKPPDKRFSRFARASDTDAMV